MYSPDRAFMRKLKALDKRLGCKFNGEHFVITYQRATGEPVNIWKVVDNDGTYRQPDRRDLECIQMSDIEKESPRDKFNRTTAYMAKTREDQKRRAKEEIRDRTKDDRRQLMQGFSKLYGGGKGNSAFRRISA